MSATTTKGPHEMADGTRMNQFHHKIADRGRWPQTLGAVDLIICRAIIKICNERCSLSRGRIALHQEGQINLCMKDLLGLCHQIMVDISMISRGGSRCNALNRQTYKGNGHKVIMSTALGIREISAVEV